MYRDFDDAESSLEDLGSVDQMSGSTIANQAKNLRIFPRVQEVHTRTRAGLIWGIGSVRIE